MAKAMRATRCGRRTAVHCCSRVAARTASRSCACRPWGTATRVFQDPAMRELRGMGLSPDGTRLAYAARADAAGPYQLHLAELANGGRRVLTDPGSGVLGDLDPRFVPD